MSWCSYSKSSSRPMTGFLITQLPQIQDKQICAGLLESLLKQEREEGFTVHFSLNGEDQRKVVVPDLFSTRLFSPSTAFF